MEGSRGNIPRTGRLSDGAQTFDKIWHENIQAILELNENKKSQN